MIHRIKNYSVTLSSPDMGETGLEVCYKPLSEAVCRNQRDIEEITRKLRLILNGGVRPLVTIFEPSESRRLTYGKID